MNPKTTLLLFFLVLMLGGGILLLERRVPATRERAEADAKALAFEVPKLDHIEIRSADGKAFVLHVQAGFWRLTEPFDDVADPERVQRLITELAGLQLIERLQQKEFSKDAWKATGLDEPVAKLRLMAGKEKLLDLWLGKAGALENTSYASLSQGSNGAQSADREPIVVRTGLHALLQEAPTLWRDSKLLRLPAEKVLRVRLDTQDSQIEIARTAGGETPWGLVKPLQTRASQERVTELIAALLNLDILSSELAPVATNPGAAPTGAATPPDQLKVLVETDVSSHELTLTRPAEEKATETDAQASHRRPHFKVTSENLPVLWAGPNYLRDDRLARLEEGKVVAMGVRSLAFPAIDLRQENQAWLVHRHGEWEPANGDRVARVIETLNDTRILEFTSDSAADLAPYGLDRPFMTFWWQEQGQEERKELLFGHNAEQTAFYIKDSAEPFIRRVSADVLPRLPADPLKWKGRGVLRFSQFDLRRITLAIGAAPPAVLDYDPAKAEWSGQVGDQDITPMIDRTKADTLAGALGRLNVDDWSTAIAEGLEALKNTTIRIQITLQEAGKADAKPRLHDLRFAPTQQGRDTALYYGRLDEQPDVFFITRESLRGLLTPVLKDAAKR